MVKSEIRLKYSGLIVFTSRLLSIATGLAFVLMITTTVSAEEFGIWGNLSDVLSYFILTRWRPLVLDNPLRSQRTCWISKKRTRRTQ